MAKPGPRDLIQEDLLALKSPEEPNEPKDASDSVLAKQEVKAKAKEEEKEEDSSSLESKKQDTPLQSVSPKLKTKKAGARFCSVLLDNFRKSYFRKVQFQISEGSRK